MARWHRTRAPAEGRAPLGKEEPTRFKGHFLDVIMCSSSVRVDVEAKSGAVGSVGEAVGRSNRAHVRVVNRGVSRGAFYAASPCDNVRRRVLFQ